MNEDRLLSMIKQGLDQSLQGIPVSDLQRLDAIRSQALLRQKEQLLQVQPQAQFAGGVGRYTSYFPWLAFGPQKLYIVLALIFMLAGMMTVPIWQQSHSKVVELVELDSALLVDDLPPDAFIDRGFSGWLEYSSSE